MPLYRPHPSVTQPRPKRQRKRSRRTAPTVERLTVHVQLLSLVLQRHQVLGFSRHCFEPAQTSSLPFGLLRSRLSQEVVQVLGQVVGLWRGPGSIRRRRRGKGKEGRRERTNGEGNGFGGCEDCSGEAISVESHQKKTKATLF